MGPSYSLDNAADCDNNRTLMTHLPFILPEQNWKGTFLDTNDAKQWQVVIMEVTNSETLQEAMRHGKAVVVGNGSLMKGAGAAAWTIERANKDG